MIPIRDTEPSLTKPVLVKLIIVVNVAVFFYELSLGAKLPAFVGEYGLVPAQYFGGARQAGIARFMPVLTSMFLHGGWLHIIFNMLFLWIFGDNVEDRLGRLRFVLFYLACGAAGAYAQLHMSPLSDKPMVGASGAIAGVMGAYLILFPKARVVTVVPIFFFLQVIELPAFLFLGFWLLLQLVSGTIMVVGGADGGGTAWWAHLGGFAAGVLLVKVLERRSRRGRQFHEDIGGRRDGETFDEGFGGESW